MLSDSLIEVSWVNTTFVKLSLRVECYFECSACWNKPPEGIRGHIWEAEGGINFHLIDRIPGNARAIWNLVRQKRDCRLTSYVIYCPIFSGLDRNWRGKNDERSSGGLPSIIIETRHILKAAAVWQMKFFRTSDVTDKTWRRCGEFSNHWLHLVQVIRFFQVRAAAVFNKMSNFLIFPISGPEINQLLRHFALRAHFGDFKEAFRKERVGCGSKENEGQRKLADKSRVR